MQLGRICAQIEPERASEAAANVAALRTLISEHASLPYVAKRMPVLERYARFILNRAFDPSDVTNLGLRGKVAKLEDGRFRLRYDFSSPGQLDDFIDSPEEAKNRGRWVESILAPGARGFSVSRNELDCQGSAFRRLSVPIKAPFVLRFTVRYGKGQGWFQVGFCDDGFGNGIETNASGSLSIFDQSTGLTGSRTGTMIVLGKNQTVEIHHTGKTVKSFVNSRKATEIARVGTRTAGYVTLFVHSNEVISVGSLSIEGAIDETRVDSLRRTWVKARMKEMFGE